MIAWWGCDSFKSSDSKVESARSVDEEKSQKTRKAVAVVDKEKVDWWCCLNGAA